MKNYFEIFGKPGDTEQLTVANTVVSLPDAAGGNLPIAALITCEDNAVRFAFGDTVPTLTLGHILNANQSMRLAHPALIRSFSAINETAGSTAILHITYEYELGA